MTIYRLVFSLMFLLVGSLANVAFAGKAVPLTCKVTTSLVSATNGVFPDATSDTYSHGDGRLRCYFGVAGKDFDLVTYNSGRTLHFIFAGDPDTLSALSLAGLPQDFFAESDAVGINFFGPYLKMDVNSTAQVQMDLEFHYPPIGSPRTYELDYGCLAVTRTGLDTWLITSEPNVSLGNYYAVPCLNDSGSTAELNMIRRKGSPLPYGTVKMPIQIEVARQ